MGCKFARRWLLAGVSALAITMAAANADAEIFDYTGSEARWTVPVSGVYQITAYGAQGGDSNFGDFNLNTGAPGAEVGGYISLTAGTRLTILVGGPGWGGGRFAGGGGGGSFVFDGTSTLVAAGGGGGSSGYYGGGPSGSGSFTMGGVGSGNKGLGGGGGGNYGGGGGAGVNGGGGDGSPGRYLTGIGMGAASLTSPGKGVSDGGFGGGGGSGYYGGGGGGGFSGGSGGAYAGPGGGAFYRNAIPNDFPGDGPGIGGESRGSYLAKGFTSEYVHLNSGFVFKQSEVDIYFVGPAVPEPSTWAMTLTGFAALGAMLVRRKRKIDPTTA